MIYLLGAALSVLVVFAMSVDLALGKIERHLRGILEILEEKR